jgi:hypothetical protein
LGIWNDLLEFVEWNHSNGLNAKEIMNKWRLRIIHINGSAKIK